MANRTLALSPDLHNYVLAMSVKESDVLRRLRAETSQLSRSGMQVGPEQGQFMAMLVRLMGARRCLEIGVFTGYSALVVAQALPTDGTLVACDVNHAWTDIARRYWKEAGVSDRIELRVAPALETLDALVSEGASGQFDFVFIDADKREYWDYFERCVSLLRPGGLIALDNVLWGGSVLDQSDTSEDTVAIRDFNARLAEDDRVDLSLVPIGDGLTLARVRERSAW